jgi:hypothetical protein
LLGIHDGRDRLSSGAELRGKTDGEERVAEPLLHRKVVADVASQGKRGEDPVQPHVHCRAHHSASVAHGLRERHAVLAARIPRGDSLGEKQLIAGLHTRDFLRFAALSDFALPLSSCSFRSAGDRRSWRRRAVATSPLEVTHRTPSTRNTGEAAHHGDCFLREIIETLLA